MRGLMQIQTGVNLGAVPDDEMPMLQFGRMPNLDSVLAQLRQERERLNAAIAALEGVTTNSGSRRTTNRISAAGRRRIAAAQKARWAKLKAGKNVVPISKATPKAKRRLSRAGRKRIAAAQQARWAALRKKRKAA